MSSYLTKARHKRTGKTYAVMALDDYFGKHRYGYRIERVVLNEHTFYDYYEELPSQGNQRREM